MATIFGYSGSLNQVYNAPSGITSVNINVAYGSPCVGSFERITAGDGTVIYQYVPCGGNQQKVPRSGKSGDCTVTEGGIAINTASKSVKKLYYYLDDSLSQPEIEWLKNPAPFPSTVAYDINQQLLANGRTNQDNLDLARTTVLSGAIGSLVSHIPYIKYPEDQAENYKTNYPRLTEYLMNQLPTVGNITKITDAIHDITGLSLADIKRDLQWDNGPTLIIKQLDNHKAGETNDDTVGYFDKDTPDKLYLDVDYVNLVETETSDPDSFIFWIGVVVLHEYVHYGDNLDGEEYPGEEGRIFESRVYGHSVNPDTARIVLNRLNN